MSERKFELHGPDTVSLAVSTIDRLIRIGDGDAALLYLYILKTPGQITPKDVAEGMGKSNGWVNTAIAVLTLHGLLKPIDGIDDPQADASREDAPGESIRQYTIKDVLAEIEEGTAFVVLRDEVEKLYGKKLLEHELVTLLRIHDSLHLPTEVIMLLISHCKTEGNKRFSWSMPPMSYLEKAALDWEDKELFTFEKAMDYLKSLEERAYALQGMKAALQKSDRELSADEQKFVDTWITMGFGPDAVEIAYVRTIEHIQEPQIKYINGIMTSWHKKGLHTAQEIILKDSGRQTSAKGSDLRNRKEKFGEATQEERERMERTLQRIKDE